MKEFATKINIQYPKENIYRSFQRSEIFQYIDTCFLLLSILSVLAVPFNAILNIMYHNHLPYFVPVIYGLVFFIFHRISKNKSKEEAKRYLSRIDTCIKSLNL